MKFQLLIKTKIPKKKEVSCFMSLRCCIYRANKCLNANNCWHFNNYEQNKFRAQLIWVWKKFYNLGACATGHKSLLRDHSEELHARKDGRLRSSVISESSEMISNNAPFVILFFSVWIRHHIDVSKVRSKFSKARVIFPSFLFLRQKLWGKNKRSQWLSPCENEYKWLLQYIFQRQFIQT